MKIVGNRKILAHLIKENCKSHWYTKWECGNNGTLFHYYIEVVCTIYANKFENMDKLE